MTPGHHPRLCGESATMAGWVYLGAYRQRAHVSLFKVSRIGYLQVQMLLPDFSTTGSPHIPVRQTGAWMIKRVQSREKAPASHTTISRPGCLTAAAEWQLLPLAF